MIIEMALDTIAKVLSKPDSKLGKKITPFLVNEKTQNTFAEIFAGYNSLVDKQEEEVWKLRTETYQSLYKLNITHES